MPINLDNKASTVRRPASATDNAVTRFDGTTGDLVQNSVVIISDVGAVTGVTALTVDNINIDGNTVISTNTDGNITVTPNGTGKVVVSSDLDLATGKTLKINNVATLSATALGTAVVASSLTSVGTLTTLAVDNLTLDSNTISSTNTDGNIILAPNGTGSTVVAKIAITEGANARMGISTLVAGEILVETTAVAANSRIFLTSQVDGGVPGFLRVSARVAATSFVITSSSVADTSEVAWIIITPA